MSNRNVYKIGFFIMLIVNVAVIAFVLTGSPRRPGGPNGDAQIGLKDQISDGLGLTKNQKNQYMQLAKEHREELRIIERSQKEQAKEYFEFLKLPDPSSDQRNAALTELSRQERAKIEVTYMHFEDLKALCNPSQLANFDQIMDQVIAVLLNDRRNNPPPPRGR